MKFWKFAFEHTYRIKDAIRLIQFARAGCNDGGNHQPEDFRIKYSGRDLLISLRKGTTDIAVFSEIFRDEIYRPPNSLNPEVIVDIGGNIGMASLYFSLLYPNASIHIFEPIPENITMIKKNVESNKLTNIIIHPYGLSDEDGMIHLEAAEPGGFGNFTMVLNHESAVSFPVRGVRAVFEQYGLKKIDLLKIDCEGAEVQIFNVLQEELNNIDVIIGELHPLYSNSNKALNLLTHTHRIDFEKKYDQSFFPFRASLKPWVS